MGSWEGLLGEALKVRLSADLADLRLPHGRASVKMPTKARPEAAPIFEGQGVTIIYPMWVVARARYGVLHT